MIWTGKQIGDCSGLENRRAKALGVRLPPRPWNRGRVAEGTGLLTRGAKAPQVRILPVPSVVYHVTTPAKLARYQATGAILPPVRFWPGLHTAERWAKRTGRTIILAFERPATTYPMPDHRPAEWTPELVREWAVANRTPLPFTTEES